MKGAYPVLLLFLLFSLAGCEGPSGAGLAVTPLESGGPVIVFNLDHKPLPEIPLPNNIATRLAPETPTGRRVNISLETVTQIEYELRVKINQLDGFGVFQPITVSFDKPLDLENLQERHIRNHDFSDDCMLLVNVDRKSPGFGEIIPLDFGQGNYPLGLEWPDQYWDQDEHADSINMLFETHDEDLNGNGALDPYEDIDFDGVLDKPNTFSGKVPELITPENFQAYIDAGDYRPVDDLITFYERETNTLIAQPVVPLRQSTTYAVVLTRNLVGEDGKPVQSPFKYVNHVSQNAELASLDEVLASERIGMTRDDIAFAWTYTTQTITDDMQAIRAGMYGHGPLSWLEDEYPPDMDATECHPFSPSSDGLSMVPSQEPYLLHSDDLGVLFEAVAGPVLMYDPEVVEALKLDNAYTDYWVLGSYTTPYFLADKDGIATPMYPSDDNESFDVNPYLGTATTGPNTVTFMCSIPKATDTLKPPFPVVMYGHGYSGANFEIFGFAGRFAEYGYALCAMDIVGHGIALPSDEDIPYDEVIPALLAPMGLSEFYDALTGGRIRDLDNDGKISSFDNGGDFWSWDLFHTRDMVRQAVIDHMQWIRILRSLGELKWATDVNGNGEADDLMGDWNGDGVVDIGTAANAIYPQWGQSMGAIISQVTAAVEPVTGTAAPISGAGGLAQVGIRTTNPGVPEAVFMPFMGPFVVFTPLVDDATDEVDPDFEEGTVEIAFMINDQHREDRPWQVPRPHYYPMVRTTKILPGDRVIVRNKTNGKEVTAFRPKNGSGFRVSLPCDALSAVEKRSVLGLQDGDTEPVVVSCAPGTWAVPTDDEGLVTGPANCGEPDLERSLLLGDALEITVLNGWDGEVKEVFDTFTETTTYEGAVFVPGNPLVALGAGFGEPRNTPPFRRLMGFASMIIDRGDPIAYARHYGPKERLDFSYDPDALPQTNIIIYHSIGDPNVPISTSLNLARAAGILEYLPDSGNPDDLTQNDRLHGGHVGEGAEGFWRYLSSKLTAEDWDTAPRVKDLRWLDEFTWLLDLDPTHRISVHMDPDNLDNGIDEFGEPNLDEPIRATVQYDEKTGTMKRFKPPLTGMVQNERGFSALRLPYVYPLGSHGVEPSHPGKLFNINNLVENQICLFMASNGTKFSDDPCLANSLCSFLPKAVRIVGDQLQKILGEK